jgi:hypothetical protein
MLQQSTLSENKHINIATVNKNVYNDPKIEISRRHALNNTHVFLTIGVKQI